MRKTILVVPIDSVDRSTHTIEEQLKKGILFTIPGKEKVSSIDVDVDLRPKSTKYQVNATFLDKVLEVLEKDNKDISHEDIDFIRDGFYNN